VQRIIRAARAEGVDVHKLARVARDLGIDPRKFMDRDRDWRD
jgi:hypothetical protein